MQGAAPLPLFTQGAAAQARPGSSIARGATNPSAPGRPAALSDGADLPSTSGAAAQQQQQAVRLARTYLQRGKPHDALATIDRVLVHSPNEPELLHLKATCLEALNSIPAAFATHMATLALDPCYLPSILSLGTLYKVKGMLLDALAAYTRAHELAPDNREVQEALALVLADFGTRLKAMGNAAEAMAKYQQAVQLCPTCAAAHYNLGVITSEQRLYDQALEHYQRAIQIQPNYPQAHCNMGVIYKERGELEVAISCYEKALVASPNFAIVQANLAIALTDLGTKVKLEGRMAEAIALYERALMHNSKYTDAMYNLGVAFGETGQLDKAMFMYELAVHLNPNCVEAHNNLGVIFKEKDNMERAVECYMAALSIRPNFPQSLNNLGVVYTSQGHAQEALTLLTAAIQACPTYSEAYNNLGVLQRDVGAIREAIQSYTKCLELAPDSRNGGQNRLLALNYIYPGEDTLVCDAHRDWGLSFQRLYPRLPSPTDPHDLRTNRPLVVGYISPDLFTHSVSYFAEAPLTHHRGERVRHVTYCCAPKYDAKTYRLRAAVEAAGGVWRDVARLSEADLAAQVRADKVDILVELTGHTANNRLGTMAMRPAPVQVTWIGYPNSTGLEAVDYRFTDAVCDPTTTKQTFVEELVRLPGCFLCYTPAVDAPAVSELPALSNGYITFGSFNNLAKVTQQVIKCWAKILQRVPGSRLVLKNKPFACETAKAHFMNLLSMEGVESSRVDLLPLAAANSDHLATYSIMDISLDPYPYAGTTTTCESLFMGVPCITLEGQCHAHNVGVSLLTALGMVDGWVARSEEEYIELAVRHAEPQRVKELAHTRATLRQKMLDSPLCDGPKFVAGLEDTYHRLWRRYVDSCPSSTGSKPAAEAQTAALTNGEAAHAVVNAVLTGGKTGKEGASARQQQDASQDSQDGSSTSEQSLDQGRSCGGGEGSGARLQSPAPGAESVERCSSRNSSNDSPRNTVVDASLKAVRHHKRAAAGQSPRNS